jgi:hypothetical protein
MSMEMAHQAWTIIDGRRHGDRCVWKDWVYAVLEQKMAGGNKGGRRVVDMAISGVWLGSSVGSGSKRARNVLD